MFIYNILYQSDVTSYLYGLTLQFNEVLRTNPDWSYLLLNKERSSCDDAHLIILDLTERDVISSLTEEEERLIVERKTHKLLVLLRSHQVVLAKEIYNLTGCSILCVDEKHFAGRELVEYSMKKKRYISPSLLQCVTRESQNACVHFTLAEKKVFEGLSCGKRNNEIAQELFRSEKTISSHKRRIMIKLGATDELSLRRKIMEVMSLS